MRRLKKILAVVALAVALAAALAYAADYGVFRFRVATNRNPYGSVAVEHYYAVPQKNGKDGIYLRSSNARNLRPRAICASGIRAVLVSESPS